MNKARLLQELVQILETSLGQPAVVRSPFYLTDRVTGRRREVDVYIEDHVRGETRVSILECRHHKRKVDVSYIEQVVTKSNDLGRSHTHVVSTSGFTKGAMSKAQHHGIALSTLADAQDPEWSTWVTGRFRMVEARPQLEIVSQHLHVEEQVGDLDLPPTTMLYRKDGSPDKTIADSIYDLPWAFWQDIDFTDPTQKVHRTGFFQFPPEEERFIRFQDRFLKVEGHTLEAMLSFYYTPLARTFAQYRDIIHQVPRSEISRAALRNGALITLSHSLETGELIASAASPDDQRDIHLELALISLTTRGASAPVTYQLRTSVDTPPPRVVISYPPPQ